MSSELLEHVFAAHGGLSRWRELAALRALTRCGGLALPASSGRVSRRFEIMMSTREPWVVVAPFSGDCGRARNGRVWLEHDSHGTRDLSATHGCARLDKLHGLRVRGRAMWQYLCTPFLLAQPDALVQELSPWREGGETWRRILVRAVSAAGTGVEPHLLYVDRRGYVRRHDCPLPGGQRLTTAHYCRRHRAFGGIVFATRRRAYPRLPGGEVMRFPPLAWLDIDWIETLDESPDSD